MVLAISFSNLLWGCWSIICFRLWSRPKYVSESFLLAATAMFFLSDKRLLGWSNIGEGGLEFLKNKKSQLNQNLEIASMKILINRLSDRSKIYLPFCWPCTVFPRLLYAIDDVSSFFVSFGLFGWIILSLFDLESATSFGWYIISFRFKTASLGLMRLFCL